MLTMVNTNILINYFVLVTYYLVYLLGYTNIKILNCY